MFSITSHIIIDIKWQNRLKIGTYKPMLKVKMQSHRLHLIMH